MDYLKAFPALEGLVDLANRDIDINPTLLRVLTDLYVTKPRHSREEERQYTELALRLLDVVDVTARYNVAQRLAPYPQTPIAVVRRLARDVIAVAEPILRNSQSLSEGELLAIAKEVSASHVAAVAARRQSSPQDEPGAVVPSAALFAGRNAAADELNDLFFNANATERRLILLNLDMAPFPPAKPVGTALASEAVRRLETAALSHNAEAFARELMRALSIPHSQARQVTDDPSGEAIVVAAKALGMSADVLQRVLLCLNPAVGQSVQRVYDLAALHEELKPEAGLRMVAIWQACGHAQRQAPKPPMHQPQYSYSDDRGRFRISAIPAQRRPAAPAATEREPLPRFGKKRS